MCISYCSTDKKEIKMIDKFQKLFSIKKNDQTVTNKYRTSSKKNCKCNGVLGDIRLADDVCSSSCPLSKDCGQYFESSSSGKSQAAAGTLATQKEPRCQLLWPQLGDENCNTFHTLTSHSRDESSSIASIDCEKKKKKCLRNKKMIHGEHPSSCPASLIQGRPNAGHVSLSSLHHPIYSNRSNSREQNLLFQERLSSVSSNKSETFTKTKRLKVKLCYKGILFSAVISVGIVTFPMNKDEKNVNRKIKLKTKKNQSC